MRAQDLCEAEAETASAVDVGRSWKAKEEVDLFFRFQGSFCHLERIRVHLCGSVANISVGSARDMGLGLALSFVGSLSEVRKRQIRRADEVQAPPLWFTPPFLN